MQIICICQGLNIYYKQPIGGHMRKNLFAALFVLFGTVPGNPVSPNGHACGGGCPACIPTPTPKVQPSTPKKKEDD